MTYVLIIALRISSGTALTTIPGYQSLEACQHAAEQLPKSGWNSWISVCIEGPKK